MPDFTHFIVIIQYEIIYSLKRYPCYFPEQLENYYNRKQSLTATATRKVINKKTSKEKKKKAKPDRPLTLFI